jgi:hypothetical protein
VCIIFNLLLLFLSFLVTGLCCGFFGLLLILFLIALGDGLLQAYLCHNPLLSTTNVSTNERYHNFTLSPTRTGAAAAI